MTTLAKYLALAAIAVILGSCSFAIGALNHKKSRVVASAIWHPRSTTTTTRTVRSLATARALSPYVAKRKVLPPRPAGSVARTSRSVAPVRSKDISASTDVDFITYTITNLDPSSGEPDIFDYLDPFYPYIDVFLTPGQNYRITVDVTLLASSPLAANTVGITGYGDSAFVSVPADGSDVWVDMAVHAIGTVFENQVASGTTINYVNPVTGPGTKTASPALAFTNPQDKFFYTSDSLLYYFNFNLNTVIEWTSIASALNTSTPTHFFTGTAGTGASLTFHIYAICPDPAYPGWFYVVGFDSATGGSWQLYEVNYDPAGGITTADWTSFAPPLDITADLVFGGASAATVVVTGVTADPYGFVYLTYYNTPAAGGNPVSGMAEFDSYYGGPAIYSIIPSDTTTTWTSANSIFTDVMYNGSNLYVLASPNTSAGVAGTHSTGTADIYSFDTFFNQLSANPSQIARSYNGTVTLSGGSSLTLPNKFTGTVSGGTFFFSQTDFAAAASVGTATEYLSAVPLDLSSVTVP
jgi:hypothetical protein